MRLAAMILLMTTPLFSQLPARFGLIDEVLPELIGKNPAKKVSAWVAVVRNDTFQDFPVSESDFLEALGSSGVRALSFEDAKTLAQRAKRNSGMATFGRIMMYSASAAVFLTGGKYFKIPDDLARGLGAIPVVAPEIRSIVGGAQVNLEEWMESKRNSPYMMIPARTTAQVVVFSAKWSGSSIIETKVGLHQGQREVPALRGELFPENTRSNEVESPRVLTSPTIEKKEDRQPVFDIEESRRSALAILGAETPEEMDLMIQEAAAKAIRNDSRFYMNQDEAERTMRSPVDTWVLRF